MIRATTLSIFGMAAMTVLAFAQPPADVQIDPAVHAWFEGLIRADGTHCCGAADCRVAGKSEVRTVADGFEVFINGAWSPVPPGVVVHRDDSPLAATIVCKSHYADDVDLPERLYCIIPYTGG